jgi:hypothetical protein
LALPWSSPMCFFIFLVPCQREDEPMASVYHIHKETGSGPRLVI